MGDSNHGAASGAPPGGDGVKKAVPPAPEAKVTDDSSPQGNEAALSEQATTDKPLLKTEGMGEANRAVNTHKTLHTVI